STVEFVDNSVNKERREDNPLEACPLFYLLKESERMTEEELVVAIQQKEQEKIENKLKESLR
ncbi:hypothetical protein SFC81_06575, partial [Enterococcus faecalis]